MVTFIVYKKKIQIKCTQNTLPIDNNIYFCVKIITFYFQEKVIVKTFIIS